MVTAPNLERITFDPHVMGGRACIRHTRVTVSLILNLIANGMTTQEIIEAYPYLEPEDIAQALQYAAWLAEENVYTSPRPIIARRSASLMTGTPSRRALSSLDPGRSPAST